MARPQLSASNLPSGAILDGDTTPNPGVLYAYMWSTTLQDVVVWNGTTWEREGSATDTALYGLTGFNQINYMKTDVGGGEPGAVDATNGFGVSVLFRQEYIPDAYNENILASCSIVSSSAGSGWQIQTSGAGTNYWYIRCGLNNAPTSSVYPGTRLFLSGTVGQLHLYTFFANNANVLHWVGRDLEGTVALSGYVPAASTTPTYLGKRSDAGWNLSASVFGMLTFRGAPTAAHIQALADVVRANGDFPDTIAGATVTHVWSVRRQLQRKRPVAPVSIPDQTTQSTTHAMTRVGTALRVVRALEDRTHSGLTGLSAGSAYTKTNGGIAGSDTFWIGFKFRLDTSRAAIECFASMAYFSGSTYEGWDVYTGAAGNTLVVRVCNTSNQLITATVPLAANDYGFIQYLFFTVSADYLRVYLRRPGGKIQEVTTPVKIGTFKAAVTQKTMRVGATNGEANPLRSSTLFGFLGGNGILTAGQMQQCIETSERLGTLQPVLGVTDHLYEITLDYTEAGNKPPTTLRDRVGTDHLSRLGAWEILQDNALYGMDLTRCVYCPDGTTDVASTAGFYAAVLFRQESYTNWPRILFGRSDVGSRGWYIILSNALSGSLTVVVGNGVTLYSVPAVSISTRLKQLIHVALRFDGLTIELWIDGVLSSSVNLAQAGTASLLPSGWSMTIGGPHNAGTYPGQYCSYLGACGGPFVPTAAEMLTAATTSLTTKHITAVPDKTSHLYDLALDITEAGNKIPGFWKERITGTYPMLHGGGLDMTIGIHKEYQWNWETNPVFYGAQNFSDSNYFETSSTFTGLNTGFYVAMLLRIDGQALTHALPRSLIGKQTAGTYYGFDLRTLSKNTSMGFCITTGANPGGVYGPLATFNAQDIGKLHLFVGVFDGVRIRSYVRRAELSTGVVITGGYRLPDVNAPLRVGRSTVLSNYDASELTLLGWALGHYVPSAGEIFQLHDACMAEERMVSIPGKTDILVDLSKDIRANNGALPATILDRMGGPSFTTVGTPTVASHYNRTWG